MKPESFDNNSWPWLEPQTEKTVKNYDEWRKPRPRGSGFVKDKKWGPPRRLRKAKRSANDRTTSRWQRL